MEPFLANYVIYIIFTIVGIVLFIGGIICITVGVKKKSMGFKIGGLVAIVKSIVFLSVGLLNYYVTQIDY